jgi:glycosyltransferase involved in cell wall biosynthesis
MSNILVIGKYYKPFLGGIENYTAYVCEQLALKNKVTLIVSCHKGSEPALEHINGVNVIRRKTHLHAQSQSISLGLLSGVNLDEFDLVFFHAPNPWAAFCLWFRNRFAATKTPIVIIHHTDIFGRKLLRGLTIYFYRWLQRRSSKVIVHSLANSRISRDLVAGVSIEEVWLGIPVSEFVPNPALAESGREYRKSLCGDSPCVLFIGRHARYKGLDVLVKSAARLDSVHFVIAGDGPYQKRARELADKLKIGDRVHFIGRVDEEMKKKLLLSADLFCMPSTDVTEVFGIAQVEAMAARLPVVTTNLPTGVTDVAIHESTALLASPGDESDLARQIQRMLTDPVLRARLREGAFEHVSANFSQATAALKTESILERVISDGATS